jgi:hypothetical protein
MTSAATEAGGASMRSSHFKHRRPRVRELPEGRGRARALAPARPDIPVRGRAASWRGSKDHVDPDILADRSNRARATAAPRRGSSPQAAGDGIFLYLCRDASYVENAAEAQPQLLTSPSHNLRSIISSLSFQSEVLRLSINFPLSLHGHSAASLRLCARCHRRQRRPQPKFFPLD